MRRFNYASYMTPDDPKRQRTERYSKIRTEETTPHAIAREYLADLHDAVLLNVEGRIDSDVLSQNKMQLTYSFDLPFPGTAVVEMQEVEEAATHPATASSSSSTLLFASPSRSIPKLASRPAKNSHPVGNWLVNRQTCTHRKHTSRNSPSRP